METIQATNWFLQCKVPFSFGGARRHPPFNADFEVCIHVMESIQAQIAAAPKCMHFIVKDQEEIFLQFTHHVFTKQVSILNVFL